jgi:DGQHR domain-containing protein
MRLKVIPFTQHGKTMYVGKIAAKELAGRAKVDIWRANNNEGYQRAPEPTRAKAFMRFIASEVSPPAILANIRDKDAKKVTIGDGFLDIPDNITLWLMDGQHRFVGIEMLNEVSEKYQDLEFPIVIMVGESVYNEAKQFVLVNMSQKKVRTDLGERFIQRAVKEEGIVSIQEKTMLRGIEWIPTAIEVTDYLIKDSHSIWHNKIKLPNEPKGNTIVNQKSFTDSLKPVINPDGQLGGKSPPIVASILNNYWDAIHELCPKVFVEPENFVIQKTPGVFVLHAVLERILRKLGKDEPEKRDFIKILGKISSIKIHEKWHKDGEFGRMMGQKGFGMIKTILLEELERGSQMRLET